MDPDQVSTFELAVNGATDEGYEIPQYYTSEQPAEIPTRYSTAPEVMEPGMRRRMVGDSSSSTSSSPSEDVPVDRRLSHSYLHPTLEKTSHKRTPQNGPVNWFLTGVRYRFLASPHFYRPPTVQSHLPSLKLHRDSMGRTYTGLDDMDRYMTPDSAELRKLVVAATDDIYTLDRPGANSWRRTHVRNVGPLIVRLAYWPLKDIEEDSGSAIEGSGDAVWLVALKWLPSVVGLFFVLPWPTRLAVTGNRGLYDPFPYQYWGYPKVFKNVRENRQDFSEERTLEDVVLSADSITPNPTQERLLRPSYLCYLHEQGTGIQIAVGSKDPVRNGATATPYVFLAFSTRQFDERNEADMAALQEIGEVAARQAGVKAFWCSAMCMPSRKVLAQDMYRMSDIIRGAETLAIALKPSHDPEHWEDTRSTDLLVQFSARMWTFPEVLLSPQHKDIVVYKKNFADVSSEKPESKSLDVEIIPKRDFARRAWSDAAEARQLLDHYLGTQILSRLELTVIAFRCLHRRRVKELYFQGDLAYALMGLLRRRPKIDSTDTEFQATARLSLVNDTDRLFERLICLLPRLQGGHWLTSDDAWGACPWDIQPRCQIAGICDNDTAILDGCHAAAIQWDGFKRVVYTRRVRSWKRFFARLLFRLCPVTLVIFAVIISSTAPYLRASMSQTGYRDPYTFQLQSTAIACIIMLIVNIFVLFTAPYLVKIVYGGKIWECEARLFGFEGYMDIQTIEAHIFGHAFGRMRWSAAGSKFSRHSTNELGERVGRDPTDDPKLRRIINKAKNSPFGAQKVFTIVDTLSLTVHMITAVRPPVMALVAGSEGGMLRAVLCSYDWKTQTLFRESVLRMETPSIDYMTRISRVRFGFDRPMPRTKVVQPTVLTREKGIEDLEKGTYDKVAR